MTNADRLKVWWKPVNSLLIVFVLSVKLKAKSPADVEVTARRCKFEKNNCVKERNNCVTTTTVSRL